MSNTELVSTTQLAKYDAACRAVAECKSVDEAMDILDKAVAIAAYARQAKNKTMEADAKAIRMRATRKVDELRRAQKETVGLNRGVKGSKITGLKKNPVMDDRPTLASQGIDKNLAHKGRVLGAMSDEKFEEAVADARVATTKPNKPKETKPHSKSAPSPSTRLIDVWREATPEERTTFVARIKLTNLYMLAPKRQKDELAGTIRDMDRKAKTDGVEPWQRTDGRDYENRCTVIAGSSFDGSGH
jgi:hypothetical protein